MPIMTNREIWASLMRGGDVAIFMKRKPSLWCEAGSTSEADQRVDYGDELFDQIPEFDAIDVFGDPGAPPLADFTPQFIADHHLDNRMSSKLDNDPDQMIVFIIKRDNGRRYLVNTEGYDYARYIVRLVA